MGGTKKEVVVQQEVFRWGGVLALLYAAVLLVICPCDVLLKCKNHSAQFSMALAIAIGLVAGDRFVYDYTHNVTYK